ncbi:MAG: hypothetical protein AAGD07_04270 [Planctomycetota bacterium]
MLESRHLVMQSHTTLRTPLFTLFTAALIGITPDIHAEHLEPFDDGEQPDVPAAFLYDCTLGDWTSPSN